MSQNVTPEKDSLLALALAAGETITDVAEKNGVDRRTLYRKLDQPAFHRLVCAYRDKLIGTALGRIADNLTRAADTLAALLDAPEAHIRIRAARSLFTLGVRVRDSVELAGRVRLVEEELERKTEALP